MTAIDRQLVRQAGTPASIVMISSANRPLLSKPAMLRMGPSMWLKNFLYPAHR
jgi:hypothetical protein